MIGGDKITIQSGSKINIFQLIILVLAIVALGYLIKTYYGHVQNKNIDNTEKFENNNFKINDDNESISSLVTTNTDDSKIIEDIQCPTKTLEKKSNSLNGVLLPNEQSNDILSKNQYPIDEYPKDKLSPSELLPADPNSKWALVNPQGQGELCDQNFLEAGFHIGTNTVGQTLRNPNLQLRSEPANPQVKVSPWMQSTMEADVNRRGLEIGSC